MIKKKIGVLKPFVVMLDEWRSKKTDKKASPEQVDIFDSYIEAYETREAKKLQDEIIKQKEYLESCRDDIILFL